MYPYGQMFDFCKSMYAWMPGFDLVPYVKLGDIVLTKEGYKLITGKDYADPDSSVSGSTSTSTSQSTSEASQSTAVADSQAVIQ
ncbi:hypothetical protein [Lactobacillus sp. 3B(2020)]|uniref:hypothetical protein n=1 Tax=Lactobacillus sp. 3B(2020) TaxID=2695882 RepID=UPI0015DF49BE|nr:hypothetical protein [Lactobacillus sp. 3B(2020)]QLL69609.1 hypothetical protein GTO83_03160 [Lactobacillus sp. 3B(2020)]